MFTILCRIDKKGQYYNLLPDVCIYDIFCLIKEVFPYHQINQDAIINPISQKCQISWEEMKGNFLRIDVVTV